MRGSVPGSRGKETLIRMSQPEEVVLSNHRCGSATVHLKTSYFACPLSGICFLYFFWYLFLRDAQARIWLRSRPNGGSLHYIRPPGRGVDPSLGGHEEIPLVASLQSYLRRQLVRLVPYSSWATIGSSEIGLLCSRLERSPTSLFCNFLVEPSSKFCFLFFRRCFFRVWLLGYGTRSCW